MSQARALAGTRKGAFLLTSDRKPERRHVTGPRFTGRDVCHVKASPADPTRLCAAHSARWFAHFLQRSGCGGKTPNPGGGRLVHAVVPGNHQWYDGTLWDFKRVWHLEPSPTDPALVYARVEAATIFQPTDGRQTWRELSGLPKHRRAPRRQTGPEAMSLHTILLDPGDPGRMFVAISPVSTFRTSNGGGTRKPINHGLRSEQIQLDGFTFRFNRRTSRRQGKSNTPPARPANRPRGLRV